MGYVGGQAVLEGVMMRGNKCIATSVRKRDGLIFTKVIPIKNKDSKLKNIPIIRGVVNLIESLKVGMEEMNFSAKMQEEDREDRKSNFYKFLDKITKGKAKEIDEIGTLVFSVITAVIFFTFIPTFLTSLLRNFIHSVILLNIIEATFKLVLFIGYIYLISEIEEIDRVFRYHGAEHKAIATYEANLPLNVENVRKSPRYHARCGTNFLFLVILVSAVIFTFIPTFNLMYRVVIKILLIPLVAGLTFELIMWLGKNNTILSRAISMPGKAMQFLTTKEPDDKMIEVAIEALKYSEGKQYTIKEARDYGLKELKEVENGSLDRDLLLSHVTKLSRNEIIMNLDKELTQKEIDEYRRLIQERKTFKPIGYILNQKEFMGLCFEVDENTLIPRADTEILVEKTEEIISIINKNNNKDKINILDMCTGSGAIGISLAKRNQNVKATLCDISHKALEVARRNVRNLEVLDRVETVESDLFENIRNSSDFEIIVSNPPYIRSNEVRTLMKDVREFEPKLALDGGLDGLDFYRKITDKARKFLKDSGYLVFEIGHDQAEDVKKLFLEYGYKEIEVIKDLASKNRVICAKYIHDL